MNNLNLSKYNLHWKLLCFAINKNMIENLSHFQGSRNTAGESQIEFKKMQTKICHHYFPVKVLYSGNFTSENKFLAYVGSTE